MYGSFAEPFPVLYLIQDLRETAGRTPLVLLTLLLLKLPGLDEPFTLNTLALLPFQLLGDNSQERKSKAGRNSYSSFPISKVFSHLIP